MTSKVFGDTISLSNEREVFNMDEMKEFMKALEEGNAYDYIANNYWSMSKEDLKNILLEYIYEADESHGCDRGFEIENVMDCLNELRIEE